MFYIAIAGIAALSLVVFFIKGRNNLIAIKNSIDQVQNTIEATLQERKDCLEKITTICKKAKVRDEDLLEKITSARVKMEDITILAEAYPELSSNENFMNLQKATINLEAKLAASRRALGTSIAEYNTAVQSFPGCLFAGSLGYSPIKPKKEVSQFFTADESAQTGDIKIDL